MTVPIFVSIFPRRESYNFMDVRLNTPFALLFEVYGIDPVFLRSLLLKSFFLHLFFYHTFFDNRSSRKNEGSYGMKENTNAPANERPLEPQVLGRST